MRTTNYKSIQCEKSQTSMLCSNILGPFIFKTNHLPSAFLLQQTFARSILFIIFFFYPSRLGVYSNWSSSGVLYIYIYICTYIYIYIYTHFMQIYWRNVRETVLFLFLMSCGIQIYKLKDYNCTCIIFSQDLLLAVFCLPRIHFLLNLMEY